MLQSQLQAHGSVSLSTSLQSTLPLTHLAISYSIQAISWCEEIASNRCTQSSQHGLRKWTPSNVAICTTNKTLRPQIIHWKPSTKSWLQWDKLTSPKKRQTEEEHKGLDSRIIHVPFPSRSLNFLRVRYGSSSPVTFLNLIFARSSSSRVTVGKQGIQSEHVMYQNCTFLAARITPKKEKQSWEYYSLCQHSTSQSFILLAYGISLVLTASTGVRVAHGLP